MLSADSALPRKTQLLNLEILKLNFNFNLKILEVRVNHALCRLSPTYKTQLLNLNYLLLEIRNPLFLQSQLGVIVEPYRLW